MFCNTIQGSKTSYAFVFLMVFFKFLFILVLSSCVWIGSTEKFVKGCAR